MRQKSKNTDRVLGVAATGRAVHAVLIENGPDGPAVIRRYSRQRTLTAAGYEDAAANPAAPKNEQFGNAVSDEFTIEFGDGSNSSSGPNLFLASEFGGAEETDTEDFGGHVATYELELSDILSEVLDAGYGDAEMALTLSAADAHVQEIRVPVKKKQQAHDRGTLVDALTAQYKGLFDDQRVAFMPMTQIDESEKRYLAIFPKTVDPASATLMALRDANERIPHVGLIDSEVPALVGLARVATKAMTTNEIEGSTGNKTEAIVDQLVADDEASEDDEDSKASADGGVHTLIVRAGAEDTLVIFMHGDTVHHCESLRSLTAFDASETICSRVLLQQDEHGMGDVHHVLVLSEERELDLTETFGMFFPDAVVDQLRFHIPNAGRETEDAATAVVSATAAALRVLEDPYYFASFEKINFIPKKLLRRKIRLPITWHVVAMSMLIVVTTVFFMARYTTAETKIDAYHDRLQGVAPDEIGMDIHLLQARIDSMQQMYATYTRALEVLDTLLIGSDRWSRMLERTSKETSGVRGLWIETFKPASYSVDITGSATSRDQVVNFASSIDGTIESLVFSEIREWPVYSFSMKIPVADSLPEAARFLREQVTFDEAPAHSISASRSGGSNDSLGNGQEARQ
jgi:hypothetical protein